ncbi:MAG: flagellar FliJ family protein [Pseudomonadota bacterium]
MNRTKRIQRIVELKKLEEMLAAREVQHAQQQLARGQQVHEELLNYNQHYENLGQREGARKDAASWSRQRQFSEQLGKAITQQRDAITRQSQELELNRMNWREKRSRSLATEALLEKVQQVENQRLERTSAKEHDELAQHNLRYRTP